MANLTKLTDMQLARLFVSKNEDTLTAHDYRAAVREANRIKYYGQAKYGIDQWQHLVNRIVANR